jgi:hypothetical protein
MSRIFLLSPAHAGGKRAALLLRPGASFEVARQVQIGAATLGNVFTFCSGLYFRGKLAYASHFAVPPADGLGVYVITPSRGLVPAIETIGTTDLIEFAGVPVDSTEPRFTGPLIATARAISIKTTGDVILLGSIATGKYTDTLLPIFGERLRFPAEFTGRGDMSRGALLLRAVASREELRYEPVQPAVNASRRRSAMQGKRENRLSSGMPLPMTDPPLQGQARVLKRTRILPDVPQTKGVRRRNPDKDHRKD